MTFADHGIWGALSLGLPASYLGADPITVGIFIGWGFQLGMEPDIIRRSLEDWEYYSWAHKEAPWWTWLIPPYALHRLIDMPFHRIPGESWWPRLWWLAITFWLLEAAGIYLLVTRSINV